MLTSAIIAQVALAAAASVPYPSSLAKGFEAPPIFHSQGGHGICVGGKVPITVSAEGRKSTIPSKISQAFVTDFNQEQLLNSARLRTTFDGGPQTIAGTFKIPATLCIPNTLPEGAKLQTLQILNHGLGSDQSYWDIAPGYSYVDARAAAGYATLNFDRLGVGASEQPDPVNVVQFPVQIAILRRLAELVRNAKLGGVFGFSKIVLVGHSLGGGVLGLLLDQQPDIADGVITQAQGTNTSFGPESVAALHPAIASLNEPARFKGLPDGYWVYDSLIAYQFLNYKYPYFDPGIFDAQYTSKATFAVGEVFNPVAGRLAPPNFTGPVDIVTGRFDIQACGDDCTVPNDQAAAVLPIIFPKAGPGSQTFVVPRAGHNVNGHLGAPEAFAHSIGFLKTNGF